jgi:FkbM family methyltransferase
MFFNINFFRKVYSNYISRYHSKTFSQEGEDRILYRIFEKEKPGFYVDIGAHHPFRFSNTYLFYKIGWKGINIEANPDAHPLFQKFRSKDLNLNIAIGDESEKLQFHRFEEPALNSFDPSLSEERVRLGWKKKDIITIPIHSLKSVFENHLSNDLRINFLTVDVEGLDFAVLKSNDWQKYRPDYVLVECLKSDNIVEDPIYKFLTNECSYSFYAKTVNTVFFKNNQIKS